MGADYLYAGLQVRVYTAMVLYLISIRYGGSVADQTICQMHVKSSTPDHTAVLCRQQSACLACPVPFLVSGLLLQELIQ